MYIWNPWYLAYLFTMCRSPQCFFYFHLISHWPTVHGEFTQPLFWLRGIAVLHLTMYVFRNLLCFLEKIVILEQILFQIISILALEQGLFQKLFNLSFWTNFFPKLVKTCFGTKFVPKICLLLLSFWPHNIFPFVAWGDFIFHKCYCICVTYNWILWLTLSSVFCMTSQSWPKPWF